MSPPCTDISKRIMLSAFKPWAQRGMPFKDQKQDCTNTGVQATLVVDLGCRARQVVQQHDQDKINAGKRRPLSISLGSWTLDSIRCEPPLHQHNQGMSWPQVVSLCAPTQAPKLARGQLLRLPACSAKVGCRDKIVCF